MLESDEITAQGNQGNNSQQKKLQECVGRTRWSVKRNICDRHGQKDKAETRRHGKVAQRGEQIRGGRTWEPRRKQRPDSSGDGQCT